MAVAASYNFEVWRGTTPRFVFRLKNEGDPPTAMTWTDVSLTFQPKNGTKVTHKLTDSDPNFAVTDAPNAEITWAITTAESRQFPEGAKTDYEVQVKAPNGATGVQMVYLYGKITGKGGLNDD